MIVRRMVPLLIVSLISFSFGRADAATPSGRPATPVDLDGLEIQVPAPAGMSHDDALTPMYAGMVRAQGREVLAVFWPDSSLEALRKGTLSGDPNVDAAMVAAFRGEIARTPEQTQVFIADQQADKARILRSYSTDSTLHSRVHRVLSQDPEGRADHALPLEPGAKVGLMIFEVDGRATIRVVLEVQSVRSATGPIPIAYLRATGPAIIHDRVLGMFLVRNVAPTTRAVAAFQREMQTWVRETLQANEGEPRPAPSKGQGAAGSTTASPKPGDYVYVEELPEAITRVPPHYPDDARRAGIWGTVMVQALVGQDGRVKDTRIVKSIPELDAAAMEAVRQWKFKPALAKGEPVEVWVGVPIKFSLH